MRKILPTLLIVCFAAALRLWNFDFNNPHIGRIEGGDDVLKIRQTVDAANGQWEPTRFRQPCYLIHTSALLLRAFDLTNRRTDGDRIWRLTALSMIAYSVLTVLLVYGLARRVTGDEWIARVAALLMAVVPIDVIGSRYFKEDIPLMFFTTLSLLAIVSLVVTRRPIFYLLSGIAIGTAISVKYVATLLIPVFIAAHILFLLESSVDARRRQKPWLRFTAALLLIPVVFLIFNPYALVLWRQFLGGLDYQTHAVTTSHADGTVFNFRDYAGLFGARLALLPGLTLPVLAASLAGLAWIIRARNKAALLLVLTVGLWYFALELNHAKPWPFFARYYHPIIPVLCVFAAFALRNSSGWLKKHAFGRITSVALLAVCIAPPLAKTILINKTLLNETRERAVVWMLEKFPPGSNVYLVTPHAPPLRRAPPQGAVSDGGMHSLAELRARGITHVVLTSFMYDRYAKMGPSSEPKAVATKANLDELMQRGRLVREFKTRHEFQAYGFHNPVVRIYQIGPDTNVAP